MRRLAVLVALVLLGGRAAVPAAAQEATPPPGAEVLSSETCTVAPPTPAEILAILATPIAEATPAAGLPASGENLSVASEAEFPAGTPADPATAAAVADAVRQFVACLNAGDDARLFALLSDGLVRSFAAEEDLPTEAELAAELATPPVPEGEPAAILELRDARVFADGRVGIVMVGDTLTDEEGPGTILWILVQDGDRWLLDAIIGVEPAED